MKRIPLSQGKEAIVDDEDYDWLMEWTWSYLAAGYATRYELKGEYESFSKKKFIYMQRTIWEKHNGPMPEDLVINFIDENNLNNQKQNLRLVTRSQKQWNQKVRNRGTSQYKGICWHKLREKWFAQIGLNNKIIKLGYFDDEKEAARAYNKAALKYFGEFARVNEIED